MKRYIKIKSTRRSWEVDVSKHFFAIFYIPATLVFTGNEHGKTILHDASSDSMINFTNLAAFSDAYNVVG